MPNRRLDRSCFTPAFMVATVLMAGVAGARQTLPSGRSLVAPGVTVDVGSLPVNLARSTDGRFAIGTDAGFEQFLWVADAATGEPVGRLAFPTTRSDKANGLYFGLAVAADGTIYAAQGAARRVAVVRLDPDGRPSLVRSIDAGSVDFPAGVAVDGRGVLFVTDNDPTRRSDPAVTRPSDVPQDAVESAEAFGRNGVLAAFDAATGTERGRVEFPSSVPGTSNFPLAVVAERDGRRAYVAGERDGCVYEVDATDPAAMKIARTIPTGANPVALLLDSSEKRLFVANAHSDTVSVIDVASGDVTHTLLLRPEIAEELAGATPTNLALSPDEKRLYVTLGDMNAVAVADVGDAAPRLLGYVPAGWYPTGVVVSPDGKSLTVCNAKGSTPRLPHIADENDRLRSPLYDIRGGAMKIELPDGADDLTVATQKVLEANRLQPQFLNRPNPLADIGLAAGKIRHVIYVVKENRTYDQILGDLPQGNGDPLRCLFGRRVTPNQHALAERFVLLDDFYDSGDVSGDGWTWSTQAQANEYAVRNVPYNYSGRGRNFDFEGQVNDYLSGGFPATRPGGGRTSVDPRFKDGAPPVPDVAESPGGHLWDMAQKRGLSFRNYGFFLSNGVRAAGGRGNAEGGDDDEADDKGWVIPDNYPASAGLRPGGRDLDGASDVDFRRFDMTYPDSDARQRLFEKTGDDKYLDRLRAYGQAKSPSRFAQWNREFQMMLANDPNGSAVPALMTVRFPCDHTVGLRAGAHSPASMVADNDYAVGQLVEAVSHSPVWQSTAIFVIEDDAQNGPDHVDLHRSTCYVVSPWIRRGSIDHSFHNTVSVLKTIECLLGLPPMCQYDAAATPILDWTLDGPANQEPFDALAPDADLIAEANPDRGARGPNAADDKLAAMQRRAEEMDFQHADRAPAEELNRMIWSSVRGTAAAMPPTPAGPPSTRPARDADD